MTDTTLDGIQVELIRGDIASQDDLDAVVNAANAQLQMGGGVAGAIHGAAGPSLEEETKALAPIEPGEAVITGGHNLPNDHIIHVLGPVYGQDKPEDKLLANCYKNALQVADESSIKSIGFPAISTGAFGYPMDDAAHIAFTTIKDQSRSLNSVSKIRFILYGKQAMDVHREEFQKVFG